MKRKLLIGLLALAGAASSGCIIEEEHPHHVHCVGCGHVYVHGYWH